MHDAAPSGRILPVSNHRIEILASPGRGRGVFARELIAPGTLIEAAPVPDPRVRRTRLIIEGDVPSPINPPPGCRFSTGRFVDAPTFPLPMNGLQT